MYIEDNDFTSIFEEETEYKTAVENEVENVLKQAGYDINLMNNYDY